MWALPVQGLLWIILVTAGGFTQLVNYTAATEWLFFALVPVSLIALRFRAPDVPRGYRVPLYPFVPILFCLVSFYVVYSSLAFAGREALYGFLIVLSGIPFYGVSRWMTRNSAPR